MIVYVDVHVLAHGDARLRAYACAAGVHVHVNDQRSGARSPGRITVTV